MTGERGLETTAAGTGLENTRPRLELYALAIILLVYLVLALYDLGGKSLWLDEAYSLRDARSLTWFNRTHPLYFWMLSVWMRLGTDEFTLRLPSVVFGAASVVLVFFAGRMAFGSRAGLIGALLLAVSTPHLFFSREARFYAPFLTACIAEMIIFIRLTRKPAATLFAGYLLAAAACLLLNPTGIFLNVAQNIYALMNAKRMKLFAKRWFVLQAALLAVLAPAAIWIARYVPFWQKQWINHLPEVSVLDIPYELGRLLFFLYHGEAEFSAGIPSAVEVFYIVSSVLAAGVLVLVSAVMVQRRLRSEPALVWLWLVVPVAGMFAASLFGVRLWYHRYLYIASAPWVMLVAFAVSLLKRRSLMVAALVPAFVSAGILYHAYLEKPYIRGEDWRGTAALVGGAGAGAGDDAIVVGPHGCYRHPLLYYLPGASGRMDVLMLPQGRKLDHRQCDTLLTPILKRYDRFWLVLRWNFFNDVDAMRDYIEYVEFRRIIKKERKGSIFIYHLRGDGESPASTRD